MERREALEMVAGIAAGQWGLVTTAQATAVGVPRLEVARLVNAGLIQRIRQGVHAMPGVPSDAFEEVRAEWLATDPTRTAGQRRSDADPVVVSDESAAAIHGIGDLSAGGVHLTASHRLQTRQRWVSLHQRRLTAKEYQWINGLPVTTPRRTLEDLAASGRWEHSQLRDLAMDAITQGLILRSEVARSPILIRALPELSPPVSHASLRQRLANDARERGAEPHTAYNTFFRMLFLAGLAERDGWVLKGGTNLLCRLPHARSTLDLDLFRRNDRNPTFTAGVLHEQMDGHTLGRYTFRVGDPVLGDGEDIEVARVKVTVVDGATVVESFNIDLSGDIVLNAEPDQVEVPRGDSAVLPGYPATVSVRLYPVENQMADKLCAMYTRYGSGVSTRYRDLYDLALIADQLRFDRATLTAALSVQQRVRRMALPATLGEPAPGWAAAYDKQLSRTPGARPPLTQYDAAMVVVRNALTAALPGGDETPD